MASYHTAKFGDHRQGLKDMGLKQTAYHIINSDPGHTRSKQELDKTLKITFASLSRKSDKKEKRKKLEWQLQSFLWKDPLKLEKILREFHN